MNTFGKILVPTDFSEHAQAAFRMAHDLAKARGSSVVVFHVSRAPALVSDGNELSSQPAGDEVTDVWDELRKIQPTDPAVRVEHEVIVAAKPGAKQILRILDTRGCDLIVMGTRSKTMWKRLRLGSVTQDVVRRAHCPVILVTAPPNEAEDSTDPVAKQPASRVTS